MSLIIAAMPAFNEEGTIAKMVIGCRKYVDTVVVVDDGSSDSTSEIAGALGAYVVRHEKNGGYGAAIRTCFDTARKMGADKMVIIDADGQHDPAEIPEMLDPLNNGTDLVIGSRFCNGNGQNVPAYRKMGMKILNAATNVAGELDISDSQSGFRAYGKKAIEAINIDNNGMSAGSEILLQAKDHHLRLKEIEIHCSYDVKRSSTKNPIAHGLNVLVNIFQNMEFRKPLFYFTIPGVIFAAIGLAMGLNFLRIFYLGGNLSFGPTLLMMILTILGCSMAFTGIILHTLSRFMIKCRDFA